MYWADLLALRIQRANVDGSGIEDVVTPGLCGPISIALDKDAGIMYWTDVYSMMGTSDYISKIQRSNMDGSGVQELVSSGLSSPAAIALDTIAGKMYWPDYDAGKIQRANLDGTAVEDLVISGLSNPVGIALDTVADKMYWIDNGTDKIQRANLDGSIVEDLVISGLSAPYGITLDIPAAKMYWIDEGTDNIRRANLDGTGVEVIVSSGLYLPRGIALAGATGGGLIGSDLGGSYTASFWDSDINPDVNGIGNGSDPNVIGESTANMHTQSTYTSVGWDFVGETVNGPNDIWRLCEDGIDYPKLSIQFLLGDFVCPDGVDFVDYSFFSGRWGDTDCADANDCDRTDIDLSGEVDWGDAKMFCEQWLEGW
jgi:sugar lactone lactonase YvrE